MVDDLSIRQADDGFVMVGKSNRDGSRAFLRVSPTNGKLKVWTPSVQVKTYHYFAAKGMSEDAGKLFLYEKLLNQ